MLKSRFRITCISLLLISLVVILSYFIETKELNVDSHIDYDAFKSQLNKTVPVLMSKYNIPGTAIALIRNDNVDFIKGYGWADKQNQVKVTQDTQFQVASNSKTFTSWGIMKLVEKGKLDLNTPVEKYLTRWKLPITNYNNSGVTIRRLLSHTSGLQPISYFGYAPEKKLPSLEESLSGHVKGIKELRLVLEPGTKYKYSGGEYSLLQLIIEEVTGEPFSKYMEEEVLKPLGMENSSFKLKPEIQAKVSRAYGALAQSLPNYIYTEEAAAGLYTTVADFARFTRANISIINEKDNNSSPVSKKSLSQMLTPVKSDYGFAYIIKILPDGTRLVYHGGSNRGWRSQFAFLPEKGDGIVVLTNSESGENLHRDLMSLLTKWETGYYPGFYYKNLALRIMIKTMAFIFFLIILIWIGYSIRSIKNRSMILIFKCKPLSYKTIGIVVIKCLLSVTLVLVWCTAFYTGLIYNGWTFVSFMPSGFNWLTGVVILFGIFLLIRSWFMKSKTIQTGFKLNNHL